MKRKIHGSSLAARVFDVALFAALSLVAVRLFAAAPAQPSLGRTVVAGPTLSIGSKLALAPSAFGSFRRHVVVLLDTKCAASNDEAARYEKLAALVRDTPGIGLTIAAPDPVEDLRTWLELKGIRPHRLVRVTRPEVYGFIGYPTVLMVGPDLVVTDILIGGRQREDDWVSFTTRVTDQTAAAVGTDLAVHQLTQAEFDRRSHPHTQIVDVRERSEFSAKHHPGAVNIPIDELETRAVVELAKDRPVALACMDRPSLRECGLYGMVLRRLGFSDVWVVRAGR